MIQDGFIDTLEAQQEEIDIDNTKLSLGMLGFILIYYYQWLKYSFKNLLELIKLIQSYHIPIDKSITELQKKMAVELVEIQKIFNNLIKVWQINKEPIKPNGTTLVASYLEDLSKQFTYSDLVNNKQLLEKYLAITPLSIQEASDFKESISVDIDADFNINTNNESLWTKQNIENTLNASFKVKKDNTTKQSVKAPDIVYSTENNALYQTSQANALDLSELSNDEPNNESLSNESYQQDDNIENDFSNTNSESEIDLPSFNANLEHEINSTLNQNINDNINQLYTNTNTNTNTNTKHETMNAINPTNQVPTNSHDNLMNTTLNSNNATINTTKTIQTEISQTYVNKDDLKQEILAELKKETKAKKSNTTITNKANKFSSFLNETIVKK